MWVLARAMSMATTKIVLTFIVAIFLIILAILFYPTGYLALDDFANWLADLEAVRNPSDNAQSNAVVRVLVSETTIFGVVTTLVARMIVEFFFVLFGALWKMVNPPEDEGAY